MKRILSRTVLVISPLVLWAAGCQSPQGQTPGAPGALPGKTSNDASPRLNATTLFAHGHLLERQGQFSAAAEQYRSALESRPGFVAAHNRLGITLNKLGEHPAASDEFRKAIELSPQAAQLHNNLGFSLYLEGKTPDAETSLRRALVLNPDFARAHMNLGVVLAKQGRFDEALVSLKAGCGESDAHYNLGMLQAEAGRLAEAAGSFDTALRLNPQLEAARVQLREVARLAAEAPPVAAQPMPMVQDAPVMVEQTVAPPAKPTESTPPTMTAGVKETAPPSDAGHPMYKTLPSDTGLEESTTEPEMGGEPKPQTGGETKAETSPNLPEAQPEKKSSGTRTGWMWKRGARGGK